MADPSLPLSDRESKILSSFLLSRSSLQDVISLRSFAALFPKQHRNNNPSQIRDLYRDLQLQRERQIERVRKNIQLEVSLGKKVREERATTTLSEREKFINEGGGEGEGEGDVDMLGGGGVETYGSGVDTGLKGKVTVEKVNEALEYANDVLKDEWEKLDEECKVMQEELQGIVGDLSDLRYGKFDNDELVAEVLKSLEGLQKAAVAAAGVKQGDKGGSRGS